MRFQNKVALVIGGASGIGLAVANQLASEGARLVLVEVNEENLAKAVPEVKRPLQQRRHRSRVASHSEGQIRFSRRRNG